MRYALLIALTLAGCASPTGLGRADTLAPGDLEVLGALELQSGFSRRGKRVPTPWLSPVLGVRAGLLKDLELGVRGWAFGVPNLYTAGAAGYAKWRLLSPDGETGWNIALAPEVSWHMVSFAHDPTYVAALTPNLMFGYDLAGGHQIVLALKPRGEAWYDRDQTTMWLGYLGASVAWSIQAGELWRVTPELSLAWTPLSFNGTVDEATRRGFSQVHLGLTLDRRF